MKYFISLIAISSLFMACTPKDMRNNSHEAAPVYEQEPSISKRSASDEQEIKALIEVSYKQLKSGKEDQILTALENIERYTLNIENLRNPEIHDRGVLRKDYRQLMDLYGYGLTLALGLDKESERLNKLLHNYQVTIFSTCNLENINCRNAAAFQGPYGVNILNYIMNKEIRAIKKDLTNKKPSLQKVKEIIFGLYVLKNFDENVSNVHGDLFISFSSVFFAAVDIETNNDDLIKKYLLDLQNIMVRIAEDTTNKNSCSIFDVIDPLALKEKNTVLKPSFITQLSAHYYNCHTSQEVIEEIVRKEQGFKDKAKSIVDNNGDWAEYKNDYHSRAYVLRKSYSKVLGNYQIQQEIPLHLVHLYDEISYGRINNTELNALLQKYSQEQLNEFIEFAEQYAQENFIYLMHFTFNAFNRALEVSYETHQSINKEFVQETYDSLFAAVGDIWVDYKTNIARLNTGVSNVYVKLNASNRLAIKAKYDNLIDKKLEKSSLDEAINLGVSFPIVLATTYFSGVDGGGTMKIRITWTGGVDNTIEISTVKPLWGYFQTSQRNILQLLDFGYQGFNPNEYERNVGLAMAVRTGFFDAVNFDLGRENQGMAHNVNLFFAKYVDDNKTMAEYNKKEIDNIRKIRDNHWHKVSKFCSKPISSERRIEYADLYDNLYLDSKEANSSISDEDLSYVSQVYDIKARLNVINSEINDIKRTYQILVKALSSVGAFNVNLQTSLQTVMLPHYKIEKQLHDDAVAMLKDLGEDESSCIYSLARMERFQHNILVRQSTEYILRVYEAMKMLRDLQAQLNSEMGAEEVRSLVENLSRDNDYKADVISGLTITSVLSRVEEQLGFKGNKLLEEALNLTLSPHNYESADFGFFITNIDKAASSLKDGDDFLGRRGGFDKDKFIISDFDQRMRVREDLYDLEAKAGDMRNYFKNDPTIINEIKDFSPNQKVKLNKNLNVHIKNFKYFKDKLGTDEKRARVNFTNDRDLFVQYSLEKLFGNNQEGQQILNWSRINEHHTPATRLFAKVLAMYQNGPVKIPLGILEGEAQLGCAMDSSFDVLGAVDGCELVYTPVENVLDQFIKVVDSLYLSEAELYPMLLRNSNGELDEVGQIIKQRMVDNINIDLYTPSAIKRYFSYYKYKEYPEKWTWFDQFIAKEFTTAVVRDHNEQVLNMSILPGTHQYTKFYQEVVKARMDSLLIPVDTTAKEILRTYYRSQLLKSIQVTDQVIEDVVRREFSTKKEDYPLIALQYKDIPNIQTSDKVGWLSLEIEDKGPGRLMLLGERNYEVNQYQDQQMTVFKEYDCDLLPVEGDVDYSVEMEEWISGQYRSCENKVRRWMQFKRCENDKRRAQIFTDYPVNCPEELKGE